MSSLEVTLTPYVHINSPYAQVTVHSVSINQTYEIDAHVENKNNLLTSINKPKSGYWRLVATHSFDTAFTHTHTHSPWCWRLAAAAAAAGADHRPYIPPGSHCAQGWRDMPEAPPGTTEGSSSLNTPRQAGTNRSPASGRRESEFNSATIRETKPMESGSSLEGESRQSDRDIASVLISKDY